MLRTYNNENWQAIYYSYGFEGRLDKKWILTQDKPELRTEISYVYYNAGQVLQQHTKVGSSQHMYHFYTYDVYGRIKEVYVHTTANRPNTPVATYSYDHEGKLIHKNMEGITKASLWYTYDEQGRVQTIRNHADKNKFANFNQTLSYNTNGTIQSIDVTNNAFARNEYFFSFSYDVLHRMKATNYSSVLDLPPHNSRDVKNITYDKHANILSLDRYENLSKLMDDLTYQYEHRKNRLVSVSDGVATTNDNQWDAEDQTFAYDLDGQLSSSTKDGGGGFDAITYSTAGIPTGMAEDNGDIHTYLYNSEGWRIYKKTENNAGNVFNKEYYIMDGATMLAVTDAAGSIVHWNMFGNELLGRQFPMETAECMCMTI